MLGALPMALLVRDPVTVSTLSTASVGFCFIFALVMALLALTNSDGGLHEGWVWRHAAWGLRGVGPEG